MNPEKPVDHLQYCLTLHKKGQLSEAEDCYRELLETDPGNADAWFLTGSINFKLKQFENAAACFQKAADINPDFPEAHMNLGAALASMNRLDAAITSFKRVTQLEPENVNAHINIATACSMLNMNKEAADGYRMAIRLRPDNAGLYLKLGSTLNNICKFDEAVEIYRKAVDLERENPKAHIRLGIALCNSGKFNEAAINFRKAIEIDPDDSDSHIRLGDALVKLDKYDKAAKSYQQALSKDLDRREHAYLKLGNALFQQNNFEDAIKYYRESRQTDLPSKNPDDTHLFIAANLPVEDWCQAAGAEYTMAGESFESRGTSITPFLARARNSSVLGGEFIVLNENSDLLIDQMVQFPKTFPAKSRYIKYSSGTNMLLDIPDRASHATESAILIGGMKNYYHWLVDFLPRFSILEQFPGLENLPIIINADPASFQQQSLELLNISESMLIYLDHPSCCSFKNLIIPSLLSKNTLIHPMALEWLRTTFRRTVLTEAQKEQHHRYFISRRDASCRRLVNEDELIKALRKYNFDVIQPEKLSLKDQIETFSSAEFVVGPHGAGFTNIIFSTPDLKILDLKNNNSASHFFQSLAALQGQTYRSMCGTLIAGATGNIHDWDYVISVESVMEEVELLLRAR